MIINTDLIGPQRILRYPITPLVSTVIAPASARPVSVAWRNETIDLWVMVDDGDISQHTYAIHVAGTGHVIKCGLGVFIGTVVDSSDYVWHIFWNGVAL